MSHHDIREVYTRLSDGEITTRREILVDVLTEPIFTKVYDFYKGVFSKPHDLIVFMSRKSWSLVRLFLPLLISDGVQVDFNKITHDRMLNPWFDECGKSGRELKTFLVDDTFQTGRSLDECIRRLNKVYIVDPDNLTVFVLAMMNEKDNKENPEMIDRTDRIVWERKKYVVKESATRNVEKFEVNWGCTKDVLHSREEIEEMSFRFVDAMHACSEPYVGYIGAFRFPIEKAIELFGKIRGKNIAIDYLDGVEVQGYLEQEDLRPPLNDPSLLEYHNITSLQMIKRGLEAFYIVPPIANSRNRDAMRFFPTEDAISLAALRFYVNPKTGFALMIPYISLKACTSESAIEQVFPENLRSLMREMVTTDEWKDSEGRLAAHRLLRFAAGYVWGKYVMNHWFGISDAENYLVSDGGIRSEAFFDWLNDSDVEEDLEKAWDFFAPENCNVVLDQPLMNNDNRFDDIIKEGLNETPTDYFNTIGMFFISILNKERESVEAKPDDPAFPGFPYGAYRNFIKEKFPELKKRESVITTVTIMLCDAGIAVTQLSQRDNAIGTSLFVGEQSCHALVHAAPEYARFLADIPKIFEEIPQDRKVQAYDMLCSEVEEYYNTNITNGHHYRLSLNELMQPLKEKRQVLLNGKDSLVAYSALPKDYYSAPSDWFFNLLRRKLKRECIGLSA
ncbi:MAG: hypothetical protein FWG36_02085 [Oscillospiraceae bacterium]|nr:hypothetical protein [Oscillospiraceae bacterium]